jgi:hypothetical protein
MILFVLGALMAAIWLAVLLAQWTSFTRAPLLIGLTFVGTALLGIAFLRARRRSA